MQPALFGRDRELAAGRRFLAGERARGLVVEGAAGIGKTAVWRALLDGARGDGYRVLECSGHAAEARLTFVGLADLLGEVADEVLPGLPPPQARALEVALLRSEATDAATEARAVCAGLLGAVRALAAPQPVLVAIDDVPWLDPASAEAIAFAARRLRAERVRFLLTRRPHSASAVEGALARDLARLDVQALTLAAMRGMLAVRLAPTLPAPVLRRIFDATLGNPLFALELGRTMVDRGLPGIGEDLPVPDTVEELLGIRVTRLPRSERALVLAVALGADLEPAQLAAIADPAALDDAIERGVLVVDGGRVRASHPLLAAAVKQRSRARERRSLHLALARTVADETLRAHHLALATGDPDAKLAAVVAAAAARAFARGARREAVDLTRHALRLTPSDCADRPERLLRLASYLETAGEFERLRELLEANLESLPSGSIRARAWLLLGEAVYVHLDDYRRHLQRALEEAAADPGLRAFIVAKMSSALITVERIADAEAQALAVLPDAQRAGAEVERAVLFALAWARGLRGRPVDDACARWDAVSAAPGHLAESPERVAGQRHVWRGELPEAQAVFERLLALSDDRGELASYVWARLHRCELALRAGDWQTAERLLDEWAETSERELFVEPYYQRCRALLAAGRGKVEEAVHWSDAAIERAEAIAFQWDWLEGLRARGITALLGQEPERAVESLGAVWEHTAREGVDEPGVFPVAPELVEALVELGRLDQARAVTSRLRALSERQDHRWGLVSANRCDAVIRLASRTYDGAAAAQLAAAAVSYDELGLRFDRARSLLVLGRAERRLKQWAAARASLERAAAAFDELGSAGWGQRARAELARVGARGPGVPGELTPTEDRVAGLAAAGRSNKEIAQALFVTVNTVEGHLSHAYAKLGIRSRTQLAQRVGARAAHGMSPDR